MIDPALYRSGQLGQANGTVGIGLYQMVEFALKVNAFAPFQAPPVGENVEAEEGDAFGYRARRAGP